MDKKEKREHECKTIEWQEFLSFYKRQKEPARGNIILDSTGVEMDQSFSSRLMHIDLKSRLISLRPEGSNILWCIEDLRPQGGAVLFLSEKESHHFC